MILKPEIALKFATQLNKTCNFYVPPIKSFESTQPLQHRAIPAGVSHSSSGDGNNDSHNANAKALTSLESMEGMPSSKGGGVNNSGNGSQSRHSSVNGSGHSSSRSRSAEGRLEAAVESLPSSSPLILSSLLMNPSGQGEGKGEGKGEGTNENNLAILLSTLSHKETVGGGGGGSGVGGVGGGGGGRLSLQPPDPTTPSSDKNNLDTRSMLMSLPGSQGGRQEEMSGSNARARCCTITTYTTSNPN